MTKARAEAADGAPETVEKRPLRRRDALMAALLGKEIDFYPRVLVDGGPSILLPDDVMREFGLATKDWGDLPDEDLERAIKLARQSLDEVKSQTEYQDQKATRLLTVTTFLTALSGVLFTRMNDAYPVQALFGEPCWAIPLLVVSYGLFGAFLFTSLCGALITFHATRTRFKYAEGSDVSREDGPPRSRLFYRGILHVRPKAWARAFVVPASSKTGKPKLSQDLQQCYFADLVSETYLVAAKTADKLRYLDPAQRLLATSLKLLLIWLLALSVVAAIVPKRQTEPTRVELTLPHVPWPVISVGPPAIVSAPSHASTARRTPSIQDRGSTPLRNAASEQVTP